MVSEKISGAEWVWSIEFFRYALTPEISEEISSPIGTSKPSLEKLPDIS